MFRMIWQTAVLVNFTIAIMYMLFELWRDNRWHNIAKFLEDFRGRGIMPPKEEARLIWWCEQVFQSRWYTRSARIFPIIVIPIWEIGWFILKMYYAKKFLTKPCVV